MITHGADIRGIVPEMVLAYQIVSHIYWSQHGAACLISTAAPHILTLRVRDIPSNEWQTLKIDAAEALGPQFDVVLELTPPHLRIEFEPKPYGNPTKGDLIA